MATLTIGGKDHYLTWNEMHVLESVLSLAAANLDLSGPRENIQCNKSIDKKYLRKVIPEVRRVFLHNYEPFGPSTEMLLSKQDISKLKELQKLLTKVIEENKGRRKPSITFKDADALYDYRTELNGYSSEASKDSSSVVSAGGRAMTKDNLHTWCALVETGLKSTKSISFCE